MVGGLEVRSMRRLLSAVTTPQNFRIEQMESKGKKAMRSRAVKGRIDAIEGRIVTIAGTAGWSRVRSP